MVLPIRQGHPESIIGVTSGLSAFSGRYRSFALLPLPLRRGAPVRRVACIAIGLVLIVEAIPLFVLLAGITVISLAFPHEPDRPGPTWMTYVSFALALFWVVACLWGAARAFARAYRRPTATWSRDFLFLALGHLAATVPTATDGLPLVALAELAFVPLLLLAARPSRSRASTPTCDLRVEPLMSGPSPQLGEPKRATSRGESQ
ncbi:hypothetical protein ACFV23_11500 [Streptomyces sp. NPDC059627]